MQSRDYPLPGPEWAPPPASQSHTPRRAQRWMGFAGAGTLIAVGYMDPGNWATAIAGGARYGYTLLCVVLLSSVMALLLQWLAARVGLITGRDLAQLSRTQYSRRTSLALWVLCEIAIIACDLAEIIGSAVALQLLFGLSLPVGVLLAGMLAFAMLGLQGFGQRRLEGAVAALILLTAGCFAAQLALANPDWSAAAAGLRPRSEIVAQAGMLWLATGILGATVMPHNLYLHSALLRMRGESMPERTPATLRRALRTTHWDTTLSLGFAFLINAALLILAAAVFHASGNTSVESLGDAHKLLAPLLGNQWAGLMFAVALLACGLNSTVTATLAGQVTMEGFLNLRMKPWQRALITRALALVPALLIVGHGGEAQTTNLLIFSQVVLSLQLPFVVIPLVRFAGNAKLMGEWRVRGTLQVVAWVIAGAIVALNGILLWQTLTGQG
ncbi:Nramp family divalent metal transporter [Pandoraea apista]|nr:Nramp family divalent metal transporter [Pandoraea apista]AJE99183.1 manganese transporter [Pandoraea apista]AKH73284.1 manganese transporter [Pandoraea apista]AKI61680.1 manganese transporter [Pandoraea apista]AVF39896.1 divalent metal cation transporter [Pandoraea apista]OXS93064.1 divalent metal cation transporter [Pandoraea apista]